MKLSTKSSSIVLVCVAFVTTSMSKLSRSPVMWAMLWYCDIVTRDKNGRTFQKKLIRVSIKVCEVSQLLGDLIKYWTSIPPHNAQYNNWLLFIRFSCHQLWRCLHYSAPRGCARPGPGPRLTSDKQCIRKLARVKSGHHSAVKTASLWCFWCIEHRPFVIWILMFHPGCQSCCIVWTVWCSLLGPGPISGGD